MKHFDIASMFPFKSSNISADELEDIIKDILEKEFQSEKITDIVYNNKGVVVTLDNNQQIEIEIDWNEIIIS